LNIKNPYWLKSGFYSLLQNISNLFFGFGGFYLLVRVLDKNQMGTWVLFVTVTSILEVARVGFVKYGFIKFRAELKEEDQAKLYTAALTLNGCFAILVAIGMLSFGEILSTVWNAPELKSMFYVYSITSLVLVPFFQFEYLQHALLDFKKVFLIYFFRNGFLFSSILLSFLGIYKLDLTLLVYINLGGAMLGMLLTLVIQSKSPFYSKTIDWNWVWKLVHFGKFVVGTSLGSMLYSAVDQFMLGSLLSTASVAVYNVAGRITNLINIPSVSLSTIIFPHSAKLITTEGKVGIKRLYERSVGAILAIVLPAIFFVLIFPGFIIQIIAGSTYLDAVSILQVTIFLSFFLPFSYQFGVTLDSIGYPNLNFYATGSFFLISLTLNYFLISNYGIMGAAYGSLCTTIFGFIVMQIMMRHLLQVNLLNIFVNIFYFYSTGLNSIKYHLTKRKIENE
jgi:lipopolysaccharide exporter